MHCIARYIMYWQRNLNYDYNNLCNLSLIFYDSMIHGVFLITILTIKSKSTMSTIRARIGNGSVVPSRENNWDFSLMVNPFSLNRCTVIKLTFTRVCNHDNQKISSQVLTSYFIAIKRYIYKNKARSEWCTTGNRLV